MYSAPVFFLGGAQANTLRATMLNLSTGPGLGLHPCYAGTNITWRNVWSAAGLEEV
jgi:hypothetical protein